MVAAVVATAAVFTAAVEVVAVAAKIKR